MNWDRVKSPSFLAGLGVFAGSLALYLSTIAPSLSWGVDEVGVDGGELLAAANTLGVPHPPGYPTYMLLLKAFGMIVPLGDFAFRGNLLSAVLTTTAALMVYAATLRLCRSLGPEAPAAMAVIGASLAGAAFAASHIPWSLAVVTEVYALNALLAGALLLIIVRLLLPKSDGRRDRRSENRSLAAFGGLLGIGLGNHLTLLAVAVPLLYWTGSSLGLRRLASPWLIAPFIIGLSVYIYVPLSAASNPPINWGSADTFGGVFWLLTARAYQGYVFGVAAGDIFDRGLVWAKLVFSQFNALGLFVGLLAVGPLRKIEPRFLLASAASIAIISLYSITFNSVDFHVLMVPALLLFSVWLGFGFFWIATTRIIGTTFKQPNPSNGHRRLGVSYQGLALGTLAFVLIPGVSVALNYGSNSLTTDNAAFDRGAEIIDSVRDGSVVLGLHERNVFSSWYIRYVEKPDRDVAVIAVRLLQFDWYARSIHTLFPDRVPEIESTDVSVAIRSIVEHNAGRASVYFTFKNPSLTGGYDLEPVGSVWEATPK